MKVSSRNSGFAACAFYEDSEIMSGPLNLVELVRGDDHRSQMGMNIEPKELAVPVHGRQGLRALIFPLVGPPDIPMKASANGDLRQRREELLESRHSGILRSVMALGNLRWQQRRWEVCKSRRTQGLHRTANALCASPAGEAHSRYVT